MIKPYSLVHLLPFALLAAGLTLLILILSGCSGAPVKAPSSELFAKMQKPEVSMPAPATLPQRPDATLLSHSGQEFMGFDARAAAKLLIRDEVAEQNTVIAGQCSAGFNEMSSAYAVLLDEARAHERTYNLVGQKWADAEAQLQRESLTHAVENWLNRALIFLAVSLAL